MNKWIKIVTPTILAAVVVALLLMFSGLGTISLIDNNGDIVTKTIVTLDVNTFAVVMIAGVALTVLFTGLLCAKHRQTRPSSSPNARTTPIRRQRHLSKFQRAKPLTQFFSNHLAAQKNKVKSSFAF